MKSKVVASGLVIVLGMTGVGTIGFADGVVAQMADARKVEADRVLQQGREQYESSRFDAALKSWKQALKLYRELKDRLGEGKAIGNLGVAYYYLGNYSKAIELQEQRLVIAREIKDRKGEGQSLGNLGIAYYSLSNYPKVIEFQEQSLVIAREIKDRKGEGNALGNLGNAYEALGNYLKAIEFHEQSLSIDREIEDRLGEGNSLGNLGNAYDALGNYSKAIEFQKQRLMITREIKDRKGEGNTLTNLGNSYNALGNYPNAIEFHEQSLAITREIKDRYGEGSTLSNLGNSYYALGNYSKAIEYQEQHLAIAREIKNRPGERLALNNLGAALATQEPELAIIFLKQSINISESIRQEIRKLPRESQEIYTSSVAKTYRELANLLLTQGRTREAQSILELLKVQELQGYGKDQEINSAPIQFPIHPLETQSLETIEKTIASKQPLKLETLTTIGQPLVQNRDRITQEMNNSKITIGNPKALLNANPNAILIQNLVVADKLWVLWTNPNGNTKAIVVPNVNQKQLETTIEQFRKQIGNPYSNLNDLKTTSTQLYNWLIPPQLQTELAQTPKPQLIFSLDHVTRYIPVAALYDGKQYLTQRYSLSNIITTDTNMTDRLIIEGRSPTILALGTSKSYSGFSALPNVEAELKAIVQNGTKGIYPGKIQLNETFTAQSLISNLEPYRVLHIATHGSFNPKSITASFLLLGNGDRLPITDIANLNNLTTTHLVVLSACETGISGAGQDGTEISGISGYFLRRGAKSVLASLWNVNDASTALIMQQFYQTLSQTKLTKAEALQKIQQDFISGKLTTQQADAIDRAGSRRYIKGQPPIDSFAHPYFWAPFILTGNNQ